MFGIQINNENLNIEKDIENCKKKKLKNVLKNKNTYLYAAFVTIIALLINFVKNPGELLTFTNMLTTLMKSSLFGVGLITSAGIYNFAKNTIIDINKKKSEESLEQLAYILGKNNINTNSEEIVKSAIIKESEEEINKKSSDGELRTQRKIEILKNTYAFLDENSKPCGLLEKTTITTNNWDSPDICTEYFVLEDEDLRELEPEIKEVKKLVRRK